LPGEMVMDDYFLDYALYYRMNKEWRKAKIKPSYPVIGFFLKLTIAGFFTFGPDIVFQITTGMKA
jgi:hypothetical protein